MRPLPSRVKRPPSTRCVGGSEPGATELKCVHSAFHAKGEGRRRHTSRESGRIPQPHLHQPSKDTAGRADLNMAELGDRACGRAGFALASFLCFADNWGGITSRPK